MKIKNIPVEMNYFLSKEYAGISAVLYSNVDVLNCPDKPEETFVIAKNPISDTLFKGVESWVFDKKPKISKI